MTYTFPPYYNRGEWQTEDGKAFTGVPGDTKEVQVDVVKFDDETLQSWGWPGTGHKVLFLRYMFDISGVTAEQTKGKYMVYDPTVNTVTQAASKEAAKEKDVAKE